MIGSVNHYSDSLARICWICIRSVVVGAGEQRSAEAINVLVYFTEPTRLNEVYRSVHQTKDNPWHKHIAITDSMVGVCKKIVLGLRTSPTAINKM